MAGRALANPRERRKPLICPESGRLIQVDWDYLGDVSRWDLALAPDGTLWASTYRGPAHYDGRTWSFPYADRIPTAVSWGSPTYTVARDGTVLGQTPTGIVRFPAAAAQP